MKVINLDKMKVATPVSIDGVEYIVNGMTVDMFMDEEIMSGLASDDAARQVKSALLVLEKTTNIPRNTLEKLSFEVITTLVLIAKGINPFIEEED